MYNTICLPVSHILIILCIFIGFHIIYIEKYKKEELSNNPPVQPVITIKPQIINETSEELERTRRASAQRADAQRQEFLNYRDKTVIDNVFVAPERRQPNHSYPYNYVKEQVNIPTRGYPDNYHLHGLVLREDTETAYKLFGRQKFPGSNQYEYFVQSVMHDNDVKIPIKINGDKEIEEGQHIMIPGTNKKIGEFKVKLYEYDAPRYIPSV